MTLRLILKVALHHQSPLSFGQSEHSLVKMRFNFRPKIGLRIRSHQVQSFG